MRCILFCQNNYAFGILELIRKYLENNEHDYIWYVNEKITNDFPFKNEKNTSSITALENYKSDAIFVPGNEVPHYLRGLKVQIFHGLAGEKKGHFRIRHYFDLYLTQGPYFTERFNKLKSIHKDFDVIETGWPKLDIYGTNKSAFEQERKELLQKYNVKKIILYAPTFSPKLTSAPFLVEQIKSLSKNKDFLILLKFHPLMDESWIQIYKDLANEIPNAIFETEKNIIKFLLITDILISDTSSVIYEFLLLDKPVITFNNISDSILWQNSLDYNELIPLVEKNLNEDPYSNERKFIYENYHPYNDGKSAKRMIDAVEDYINKNGVPEKRKISILRRFKIKSIFKK